MSYILLREAYITNTRNESVTLGDSDKLCNSFIQVHMPKAMSESCSLANYTLCREEGSGHAQLLSCR